VAEDLHWDAECVTAEICADLGAGEAVAAEGGLAAGVLRKA